MDPVFQNHVREIEDKIAKEVLIAIEENKVSDDELGDLGKFVLEKLEVSKDHNQLVSVISEMSNKWPFLKNIENLEKGEVKEEAEDKGEKDVLNLAKSGKVEEAINLAKQITEN